MMKMIPTRLIFVLLCTVTLVNCKMEPFVVGGNYAHISHFPHSAFMSVQCVDEKDSDVTLAWICGASIINQEMVLTAGHCLHGCSPDSVISVAVGHAHKDQGVESSTYSYLIHEDYDVALTSCDIALVMLKTRIKFNENVKRVVLMKHPPYSEKAQIAGWGLTNEIKKTPTDLLKFVDQFVWDDYDCKKYIAKIPKGTICASSKRSDTYSTSGGPVATKSTYELGERTQTGIHFATLCKLTHHHCSW